jgi:Clp amino terminal domain, pathogenicity island component
MYPFERFTDPAKAVLSHAQEEAERSGHSYIGTEHLLLGLLRVADGVAARALASLGVEEGQVRTTIASVLGRNERIALQQIIPTSRVKKVIEISFAEAQRGARGHVGTGQLLIGLAIEGEGIAAHVLRDLGADPKKIAGAVAAVEAEGVTETGSAPHLQQVTATVPVGSGARVLVHDPDPPYRLWEGRVTASGPKGLEIEVAGRPAGERMTVDPMLIHPIPTGPTLHCRYCSEPPAPTR